MTKFFESENGSVEQNAKVVILGFLISLIFVVYVLSSFRFRLLKVPSIENSLRQSPAR